MLKKNTLLNATLSYYDHSKFEFQIEDLVVSSFASCTNLAYVFMYVHQQSPRVLRKVVGVVLALGRRLMILQRMKNKSL